MPCRSRSDPGGGVGASLVDPLKESGLFGRDVQLERLAISRRSETLRNLVSGVRTVFRTALHITPVASDSRKSDGGIQQGPRCTWVKHVPPLVWWRLPSRAAHLIRRAGAHLLLWDCSFCSIPASPDRSGRYDILALLDEIFSVELRRRTIGQHR